jgi:uncharacterized protein
MTVYCWAAKRKFQLPTPEERYFQVTSDTRVLAHCYWQTDRTQTPTLIALHGLEGSSTAHYMLGIAEKTLRTGLNAVLLNQRNCGGTEHLGPGLYHSGLTEDATHVIREFAREGLDRIVVAGYSLGGNLALKLAGERTPAELPSLKAVCAVSPVLELGECVRALERRSNLMYQLNFVRNLRARMRRKDKCFPGRFQLRRLGRIWTVRQFDEAYTARHFGFQDADDYYHRASAMRLVERVQIPALIISAKDDPFVPAHIFDDPKVTGNPNIRLMLTEHGGHCGFLGSRQGADDDGYWAERTIIDFARHHSSG